MKKNRLGLLVAVAALASTGAQAQDAAPRDTSKATVGGHEVAVEYGRPSLGDRSLDALMSQLPPDRVWRAGSEQVTTFTTAADVMVGDAKVPAGTYSLYLHIPEDGAYTLILNGDLGQPLSVLAKQFNFTPPAGMENELWPHFDYAKIAEKEVARVTLESKPGEKTDMFTIEVDASSLTVKWGDKAWGTTLGPAS